MATTMNRFEHYQFPKYFFVYCNLVTRSYIPIGKNENVPLLFLLAKVQYNAQVKRHLCSRWYYYLFDGYGLHESIRS